MWNIMYYIFIIFLVRIHYSAQKCREEVSENGIRVTWRESTSGSDAESDPRCYYNEQLIKRHCKDSEWSPALNETEPCLKVVDHFDLSSCPPGFHKISENNDEYCYQISAKSAWNYPCFKSGGASVITDLNSDEIDYLIDSLSKTNRSRYFWLPAQRQKVFNPFVWYIPGPNWGRPLDIDKLWAQTFVHKNCLVLDVENRFITTETCSREYPSLCFYLNDLQYPAKCPKGYHAFRFMPDNGTCFGIEHSDNTYGLTFDEFLNKCKKPMGNDNYNGLKRFIFLKIAALNQLPDNMWCWFAKLSFTYNGSEREVHHENDIIITELTFPSFEGVINNNGTLSMMQSLSTLSCMACETEMLFGETILILDYNIEDSKLYLTVYYPSGLWKYDNNDKGVQCFSDARGFVKVIDVNDLPFIEIDPSLTSEIQDLESINVEKIVYVINLVTDRSAQYWCEGHMKNFSLIATNKIVANPQGNKLHVFALVVKMYITPTVEQDLPDKISNQITNITTVFCAEEIVIMEILEYAKEEMVVLLHIHVKLLSEDESEDSNLLNTFNILKERAELELPKFNITFVNISSSMYCLPTTSTVGHTLLNWELTLIGHIAAPKQFCLQINGLPVKRKCSGSYRLGSIWGEVEGYCDENYEPSATTTFLYNFVKGQVSDNYTSRFLTDGLSFVLGDVDIIIPADIYYLSISLQHVINMARDNKSSVDMGDIENIAWVMDRVMVLDEKYLRLAQTLNSTNIILDSVNDIIEMLTSGDINPASEPQEDTYQLVIKPQFIVQISYPEFTNISGIAIARSTQSDNFTEMVIQPLYKNTTLDSVLSIENLEVATWVPVTVLNSLTQDDNCTDKKDIHIVVSIFHNDAVFQQLDRFRHRINSRIVGVSIPGFKSNLKYSIPLVFRDITNTYFPKFCGYWDFQSSLSNNKLGIWTSHGCFRVKSIDNITVCECYHMTHFGQLFDFNRINPGDKSIDKYHTRVLNIITLIGSFLSLLGIIGIWITALVFEAWRKKPSTKVLLQLSTAIALPLLFIIFFNLDNSIFVENNGKVIVAEHMKHVCIILGASLHYSILASFMWMLITAILQFIRYVRVLGVSRPSRFIVKFMLIGWGIPLIPVTVILLVDNENYIPDPNYDFDKYRICYPHGFYLGTCVLIPIFVILLTNITLFVLVIISISRGPDGKMRTSDIDLVGAQLRLSIFLFFLLGLTWIFGIFSFSASLIWSYLFCLTSTLQGFVLFIYFIICDPSTRSLWFTLMKPQFPVSSSRKSISSISSG